MVDRTAVSSAVVEGFQLDESAELEHVEQTAEVEIAVAGTRSARAELDSAVRASHGIVVPVAAEPEDQGNSSRTVGFGQASGAAADVLVAVHNDPVAPEHFHPDSHCILLGELAAAAVGPIAWIEEPVSASESESDQYVQNES